MLTALLPQDPKCHILENEKVLLTHQLTPVLLCTSYFKENKIIIFRNLHKLLHILR